MAKIIVIGNQKGGVGKTTLTALLANALAADPFNLSVTVVDADPQRSLATRRLSDLKAYDGPTPYRVEALTAADFANDVAQLDRLQDVVIVDAPGKLDTDRPPSEQQVLKLLFFADVLLIPFVPGNFALEASYSFLQAADKVRERRHDSGRPLQFIGAVNMYDGRTNDDARLLAQLDRLALRVPFDLVAEPLKRYALFRTVDTITSLYDPASNDRARANFTAWLNDLVSLLKL